jgi:hypothetical protein
MPYASTSPAYGIFTKPLFYPLIGWLTNRHNSLIPDYLIDELTNLKSIFRWKSPPQSITMNAWKTSKTSPRWMK